MRLHLREWGSGERNALLVHGLSSDGSAWWRVGPALAERGYHVTAVDLRGHGRSPRGEYSPRLFAADLHENAPAPLTLAVGHSLGGMALALAIGRIKPERAVYVEPGWRFDHTQAEAMGAFFRSSPSWTKEEMKTDYPLWHEGDVQAWWESSRRFDPACVAGVVGGGGLDHMPRTATVPSLVMIADPSGVVRPDHVAELRAGGFDVQVVPGAGHSIFRDDFAGFMNCLNGWLE
jgi:pimeloyl-ACP methyl ester carboxylesterase